MIAPDDLTRLMAQRPVYVIGAAVVDIVASTPMLPQRGGDMALHQPEMHVGGCGFNVALALHRLEIPAVNALPLGHGTWASIMRQKLHEYGVASVLETAAGDNGWCLALVEPDGERTFLSTGGVENQWDAGLLSALPPPEDSWISLSGYHLCDESGDALLDWLEEWAVPSRLLVDFGPRLAQLADEHFRRIMALRPLITVNRQEAQLLWCNHLHRQGPFDLQRLMHGWQQRFGCAIVVRLDSEGAAFIDCAGQGRIPALATRVVDTIGAGDSHTGAMLAGLASGWSLAASVELGNVVASYVVSHRGGDCAPGRAALDAYWRAHLGALAI